MKIKYILCFWAVQAAAAVAAQNADAYRHFIIYGQSLSIGYQSYPPVSTENVAGNYVIGNEIHCNLGNTATTNLSPLISKIPYNYLSVANNDLRSSGTPAECPLTGAVNHLNLKLNDGSKYIATSCGAGGKTVEELSQNSYENQHYDGFVSSVHSAKSIINHAGGTLSCPALFWMQGESNYLATGPGYTSGSVCTTDKNEYKNRLNLLKTDMQNEITATYSQTEKPLFISYQAGGQYIKIRELPISMAHLEMSNEQEDFICAGPVYQMTDRGGHLDANGYRWFGEMLGKAYYKTQTSGEKFKPLQPLKLSRTENPNEIRIQFHVPEPPLVFDTYTTAAKSNYGFEIYVGKTQTGINNVAIHDDCVILTAISSLAGKNISVIYAGMYCSGHGNLRDSDPYSAFYNYIDLDAKNTDGSWFFPRNAAETTLRPAYEPKNAEGTIIYNQPYPLYNFCVSFFYTIPAEASEFIVPNVNVSATIKKVEDEKKLSVHKSGNTINIESNLCGAYRLTILDILGKGVKQIIGQKNSRIEQICNDFATGFCLFRIEIANQTFIKKFIL